MLYMVLLRVTFSVLSHLILPVIVLFICSRSSHVFLIKLQIELVESFINRLNIDAVAVRYRNKGAFMTAASTETLTA